MDGACIRGLGAVCAAGLLAGLVACSGASGGGGGSGPNGLPTIDGGGTSDSGSGPTPSHDSGTPSKCPGGAPECGANCCDTGSTCVDDGTGTLVCAELCSTSNDCPSAKGCCTVLDSTPSTGKGACMANGSANGQGCMCSSGSECQSGTCGYAVDSNNMPVALLVCEANDGLAYDGCDNGSCGSGLCCLRVSNSSTMLGDICEKGCQNDSECDSNSVCQPLTSGNCSGYLGSCVPR
jgi:hypothetical protein